MSPSQLLHPPPHPHSVVPGRHHHHHHHGLMDWKEEAQPSVPPQNPPLKTRFHSSGTTLDPHDNAGNMECSMCGDLGLARSLFRCSKCGFRYQHTYCSNWYPHERSIYVEICNWCAAESAAGIPSKNSTITSCSSAATARLQLGANDRNKLDAIEDDEEEEEDNDDDDEGSDAGMVCSTQMMRKHHHQQHHSRLSDASHTNRLIKKASKRLVVRRYKFVSEV